MNQLRYFLFLILFANNFTGFAQEVEYPFAAEILKFKENDKVNPPPLHAILFIGSSSFAMWQDVQDYFPGYSIINRGFGGSILTDQIHYIADIVFPYSPSQIVIYCGENDLASNDSVSAAEVCERFKRWFSMVRSKLPDVKITYISIKPSPSRWNLSVKFIDANQRIREFIKSQHNADFVNIWDRMLNKYNQPDSTLFLDDRLHLNADGYKIWQKEIKPELIDN
jgi:lysophospholipase L1-like esterase